ncbi:hypothetical protein V1389_00250 [Flavobacterium rakeshii]|uniref:hypothetical protein n=1 Tax=Flavobacterium rakeshii TaxID=1038845 RepID=UPI002E7BFDC1|nr:hypothetical protein [Flavobacterium rakeshii]MEE1896743.1 hypothetical protein [Flavobacterium rakeshii]
MNLNILTYVIFLLIIVYIIVVVGKICYKNGNIYVLELLHGDKELCLRINKILLVGYYLVNIGYAAMTLLNWETVNTFKQLIETIAVKSAIIITILCILHYLNIFILTKYIQKIIND